MDQEDKRRFLERVQHSFKKRRSLEEQKRIKEEARRRKIGRRPTRRERRVDEDEPEVESMRGGRPQESPGLREAIPAPMVETTAASERALVVGLSSTRARLETVAGERMAILPPDGPGGTGLAVGDRVLWEERAGVVRLLAVEPRTSVLSRPDPARVGRRLVLAANIDLVACVVAASAPRWKPGFVDRVLLAVEEGGADALVVVNKIDLATTEERATLEQELEPFRVIGVPVLALSATTGEGLATLFAALAARSVVFVGPSGVGKSSLQNALDPRRSRPTNPVRASDGKGRHTTTSSELVYLDNGTRLIDTPGVRQFGLTGIDRRMLASYFPEFDRPAAACRFRDCSHLVEPECGVRAALRSGRIAARRYETYARIHGSLRE